MRALVGEGLEGLVVVEDGDGGVAPEGDVAAGEGEGVAVALLPVTLMASFWPPEQ